uniref:Uncharacterized protein n=1 Tax=Arion vulgaris TaxID=1028688 RepID=A0A0B7AAM3_9EUPU
MNNIVVLHLEQTKQPNHELHCDSALELDTINTAVIYIQNSQLRIQPYVQTPQIVEPCTSKLH